MNSKEPVRFSKVDKVFVRKSDKEGNQSFYACQDLNFEIRSTERVAIVGETGSGKSTALALLMGLQRPGGGYVEVLGYDPFLSFEKLRGRIGIIFQTDRLLPWRTALENVAFGLEILHKKSSSHQKELAKEWLARVGLANAQHAYPHQLSGGMRQRVSIARTFAIEPEIVVADEAFSALDELTAGRIREDLLNLIEDTRKTTIFVTHSVREAASISQRVLVFRQPGHVAGEINVTRELSQGRTTNDVEDLIRGILQSARAPAGDED